MTTRTPSPLLETPLRQDVKLAVKDGLSELRSRLLRWTSSLAARPFGDVDRAVTELFEGDRAFRHPLQK